jgi:endonuclease YncB( thermonuclease family)
VKHGDEPGQALGQESKANLQGLIDEAGEIVQLEVIERDRYGRQVAEVFALGKFLQEEQVKAGLAYHYARYSKNCPHRDAIVSAEAIAQSNHAGVWGGDYEKPWDYRKTQR